MIDCSSERIRSGLASDSASPSRPAGSTMCGAVIVMIPFERSVEGELEGSRGGRSRVHARDELDDRATPLSGTQLAEAVGGTAIRLGGGSENRLNPLDTGPRDSTL